MGENKKVIFSGIQPSGELTIGNYFGAIKNWVKLQDEYDCYYCIVDLHAITVKQEAKDLRRRTLQLIATYIASGIDPEKNTIFIQSHVPAHVQAQWILNCMSYVGELSRMTQFKDKSKKYEDTGIGAGLLNYPVLMAADILIYQADLVPVGKDQTQHIELTRDLAQRFNSTYSETFKIPEGYIPTGGAKIMSLQEPLKKMSKSSDNPNSFILIMDPPEVIKRKIARAVTDNVGVVKYTDDQPGVKNLMNIMSCCTGMSVKDIEDKYEGQGYSKFKEDVADALIQELEPIQNKVNELLKDKAYLQDICKKGAQKASYIANKTVSKMMRKVGFILPEK
ncbi:tryptophanyl-tRNA synthetase [Clostridium acetobutylicum]|uniref:Tryptophan--tRNA ligase n=1 Tax=Clostridium acetobutylicum (strain ATCC 824 / DSM 792 / JCM 1419 / IAM 19013 / LMG 5710 / NBRC 13948 / NRRL B-527 / VKM B-1787 / 2291 / W) TaxID=272562 RepID=SYW_CLOAB|nr:MULTISPECIES: tryptophan--tRNA ligase [Clostridium]Q97LD6.2 RecName: Full=Tryptophan--tRNA ligase; AltName: Full=Tryptophanyl-tRNA synthetase; Short=TrpRS [Clostridium acetobutylicum ATCC 824]ADZ19677.1 tryptophanyl-tRNA synthetase [Clostridium acetobutylicum EA 2018]KHD37612.1 tryptophanyl-tRNA synthetase [Clostridium acetobutylicum]MBC2392513.1 tryptophan--tRNA ligase [Clostridium acetobutylicum]MBC2583807.1 tryptophan--tRNA ligase [Clostridium acetobutylicum]NOV89431.1 tryptophanyl-tRNA